MKLFKYCLIALISISLFSCEKDDDTTPSNPIVGHWSLKQIDEGNGIEPFDEYFVWELNSDGKGFSRYRSGGNGGLVSFSLIWEVTNNTLRISRDGGQDWQRESILKLTSSELWTNDLDFDEELRYEKIN